MERNNSKGNLALDDLVLPEISWLSSIIKDVHIAWRGLDRRMKLRRVFAAVIVLSCMISISGAVLLIATPDEATIPANAPAVASAVPSRGQASRSDTTALPAPKELTSSPRRRRGDDKENVSTLASVNASDSNSSSSGSTANTSKEDATAIVAEPEAHPEIHSLHEEKESSGGDATVSFHYWIMTLGLTVVVLSHDLLHRFKLQEYLSESGGIILLGIICGWIVTEADVLLGEPKDSLLDAIKFDHSFFVRFVLPVIIFEQGYGMNHQGVIENIETILLLAVPGVVASAVMIGMFLFVLSPFTFPLLFDVPGAFFLCLAIGALLSATDPVAIVSILRSKFDVSNKPPTIYNVIFGESMLNDAVSIVLFEVALDYVNFPVTIQSISQATWHFVWVLIGSALCGYIHGVFGVMVLRWVKFHGSAHLEVVLTVLFAVASYYMCDFLDLSGIMALFMAARVIGHHGQRYMSPEARQHAPVVFRTLASIAESASFFMLGTAFFAYPQTWGLRFCFATVVACLLSRAVVVWGCCKYGQCMRDPSRWLTAPAKIFVWYSGMRGAVSFGLAAVLFDHCGLNGIPDSVSTLMLSSTLVVIFFTVLVLGGGASTVLTGLGLDKEEVAITMNPTSIEEIDLSEVVHTTADGSPSRGFTNSRLMRQSPPWLQIAVKWILDMHNIVLGPLLGR